MSETSSSSPSAAATPIVVHCGCSSSAGKGGKIVRRVLGLLLLLSLCVNAYLGLSLMAVVGVQEALGGGKYTGETVRKAADDQLSEDYIAVLEFEGGVNAAMAEYARDAFLALKQSEHVRGVILRIDSPGGGVSSSDQIWQAITDYRASHPDIPVVASLGGLSASGGYYIAMPAQELVVEPTGLTGHVGVIAQVPSLAGLSEKVGIRIHSMIADGSPEKADGNDLFARLRDERGQLTDAGRRADKMYRKVLNNAYDRFSQIVVDGRVGKGEGKDATEEEIREWCVGRILTAEEALGVKAVDSIGYLDDAIERVEELGQLPEGLEVIAVRPRKGLVGSLLGAEGPGLDVTNIQSGQLRQWMQDELGSFTLEYRLPAMQP